jgi:predicted amidohydrolase YtcJ
MRLVQTAAPRIGVQESAAAMLQASERLWSMGVTGVHDFDRRTSFMALQGLHRAGKLKLRVVKTIPVELLQEAIGVGLQSGFGDDFLRIGNVKAFADGALGPHTAAMLQPYDDDPGNFGMLLMDGEEIYEHGRQAVENGLGMTIHAIGDHANHEVLKAYEGLRKHENRLGLQHPRHRIEHVQVLHPGDLDRLARNHIIASMQPIHAVSDMFAADQFWGTRCTTAYAWRTLLDLGTHMAFGSDAPVDSPNPFWGLHAAITRTRPGGIPTPDGWYPEQRITRFEAMAGYTTGAAYAAGMEDRLGKLETGYYADLLVLDQDFFTCQTEQIRDLLPLKTMVNGVWVFERN